MNLSGNVEGTGRAAGWRERGGNEINTVLTCKRKNQINKRKERKLTNKYRSLHPQISLK